MFDIESNELDEETEDTEENIKRGIRNEEDFKREAQKVYEQYRTKFKKRFDWIGAAAFNETLAQHLHDDANTLIAILNKSGAWNAEKDTKLEELISLINKDYPTQKVLVFTQYADTVRYLEEQLKERRCQGCRWRNG